MPTPPSPHAPENRTVEDALARFELLDHIGNGETTACAASALAWVAGLAHTDRLPCAAPALNSMLIAANDDHTTTADQRADLVRAGATGLVDTWWLPGVVVAHCIAAGRKDADGQQIEGKVAQMLATFAAIGAWKGTHERIADLRSADLSSANLRSADLHDANLRSADLHDANLSSADLSSANLRSADLHDANLSSADLRSANLSYADLRSANLSYANLRSANLSSANLSSANLSSANLSSARGNSLTMLPAGWKIDEDNGLIVAVDETGNVA
jgi:uncharacterized protein YjbI with pentapeptide repeats